MSVWIVSHKSITDSHKSQKWPFFSIRPVFGSPHTGAPHHHSYCYRHTVLQWRDESSRRCKKLTDYNSIRTEGNHELSVARATVRRQNEKTGQVLCATNPLLTLIHNSHHHDRNEDNYFCNGFQHPKVGQCLSVLSWKRPALTVRFYQTLLVFFMEGWNWLTLESLSITDYSIIV